MNGVEEWELGVIGVVGGEVREMGWDGVEEGRVVIWRWGM